jgi:hypothetical protein
MASASTWLSTRDHHTLQERCVEEELSLMTTPPATRYAAIYARVCIEAQGNGFSIPEQSVTGSRRAASPVVVNLQHDIVCQR